jgi:hypothetical protein
MNSMLRTGCVLAALIVPASFASADVPEPVAVKGESWIGTIHAEGAQVYECKSHEGGPLAWEFREPIAALIVDGETVGVHYAGPHWELNDGSKIIAKVTGRAPGATDKDIPLLRLEATPESPRGLLAGVTSIQRLNTRGGVASGPCQSAGEMLSVPYSADYVFHRKVRWSLIPDAASGNPAQTRN